MLILHYFPDSLGFDFFFLMIRRPLISTLFPYTTLFRSRRMVFLVKVVDVDVISPEPLQAFLGGLQHPAPRQAGAVRIVAHRVRKLGGEHPALPIVGNRDRKSTRLNSSHVSISYAVFCLK